MDSEASDTPAEGITGRANPVLADFRAAEARSSRPGEGGSEPKTTNHR